MFMKFGWGEDPSIDDMPYKVLNYSFDVVSEAGDTMISNCQPTHITITVEIAPEANPGAEFYQYSIDQHDTAAEAGKGKISVFRGQSVGESIQEISFSNAWIDSVSMSVSEADDKFILTCMIAAANVTVSGVEMVHNRRIEHFSAA
jgi:hypothetical protein